MESEDIDKLFERYYQKSAPSGGAGIGLALVKELVSLYKGDLQAFIEKEKLTFLIEIPLNEEFLRAFSVVLDEENIDVAISYSKEKDQDLPTILIVNDNIHIRKTIKALFENCYYIIEASNGLDALKIAKKEIPDIIISDIMVPKMDGLTFSKYLKENEITSFIPIILLTARTGSKSHLEAIKTQADAYLSKPFNHEVLKNKVSQLIRDRERLRSHYRKELVLKPRGIVINSTEEKFIKRLQKVLDTQLFNPDFSADEFALQVDMSRMQLHRKLKSLTGFSTLKFVKKERLKMAKIFFAKEKSISEVAYALGFNNPEYFSKLFKEEFGVTPSNYLKTL